MLFAEMGNRVIQITEAQIELYNSKGYEIKDTDKGVVKTTPASDLAEANAKYEQALEKIKSLEEEIKKLKAKTTKIDTKVEKAEDEPVVDTKTTKKK